LSRAPDPSILAWQTEAGHFEAYAYAAGRRGHDPVHVHDDVQICLSLNFPGLYRSGRWVREVPAGALSVVDAWEPHAAEDPCDRSIEARYWLLYVGRARWNQLAAGIGAPPRVGIQVSTGDGVARMFAALHECSRSGASGLEQEERMTGLLSRLLPGADGRHDRSRPPPTTSKAMLDRARDFLHAHAVRGVSLAEVAGECGASPQHLSASFRARFGVPIHRFQTLMRLDHARRLLARGWSPGEAAAACGLSDQSHLTRHFRRYLGTTPGRYGIRTGAASSISRRPGARSTAGRRPV
jgi:AraC-like DNA-binding protein